MPIRKVLMIDDEPHIRRIGEICLRGVGKWDVVLASSGAEGVELAVRERPDAILLDVMMPGMDGRATLAALRSRPETAEIPVVFMTAKVLKHEVELYLSLGAVGVIGKPFDPMKLASEVARLVEGSAALAPVRSSEPSNEPR
jgi:CheY-like chemotaxis protein